MKLNFAFKGIQLGDGGTFPRAIVDITQDEASLAPNLAYASIRVQLPLKSLNIHLDEVARDAVQTAHQLLNEQALAAWLRSQQEDSSPHPAQ